MRTLAPLAVCALLVLAGVSSPVAAHGGWRTWILNAHDADTDNGTVAWFTVDDGREPNPTLKVHQGERVVLHVVNLGQRNHTLVLGAPIGERVGPIAPGNESSVSFEIPPDARGTIAYYDPDWQHRGMRGKLAINGTTTTQDEAPGVPVLLTIGLSAVAAAGSARRTHRDGRS